MIFSVIGQPDLRLGLQLLKKAVTDAASTNTKIILFMIEC